MATDQERIQMLESEVSSLKAQIAALLGTSPQATSFAAAATSVTADAPSVAAGTSTTAAGTPSAAGLNQLTATLRDVLENAQARPASRGGPVSATLRSMDVELRAFVAIPTSTGGSAGGGTGDTSSATGGTSESAGTASDSSDVYVSTPAMGQVVDSQALSVFKFSFAAVPTPPGSVGNQVK